MAPRIHPLSYTLDVFAFVCKCDSVNPLYRGFNGGPHINDWSKFHCIIVSCLNFRSLSAVGESQLMIKMQVIGNPVFCISSIVSYIFHPLLLVN